MQVLLHASPQGDYCVNCGSPFIRSFVTFEALPLVEFELEAGISEQEAESLLGEDVGTAGSATLSSTGNARWVPYKHAAKGT